jgi:phosphomannomutase
MGKILRQDLRVVSIKFGTDGWRAVLAENFNFANVALADLKV